ERFTRNVGEETARAVRGHGQAHAVDRNARAELEPIAPDGRAAHLDATIGRAARARDRVDAPQLADFEDDAGEHSVLPFRSQAQPHIVADGDGFAQLEL